MIVTLERKCCGFWATVLNVLEECRDQGMQFRYRPLGGAGLCALSWDYRTDLAGRGSELNGALDRRLGLQASEELSSLHPHPHSPLDLSLTEPSRRP